MTAGVNQFTLKIFTRQPPPPAFTLDEKIEAYINASGAPTEFYKEVPNNKDLTVIADSPETAETLLKLRNIGK